jgi:hypothetical protein
MHAAVDFSFLFWKERERERVFESALAELSSLKANELLSSNGSFPLAQAV